jgi:hypothetical protein
MNRKLTKPQFVLFPNELPRWQSLPRMRQHQLEEVLSLLVEQFLQVQAPATHDPQDQNTENRHA